ncbi:MAG: hypothetical protein ACYCQJ_05255 [Nitrososphaerales archaeon]
MAQLVIEKNDGTLQSLEIHHHVRRQIRKRVGDIVRERPCSITKFKGRIIELKHNGFIVEMLDTHEKKFMRGSDFVRIAPQQLVKRIGQRVRLASDPTKTGKIIDMGLHCKRGWAKDAKVLLDNGDIFFAQVGDIEAMEI